MGPPKGVYWFGSRLAIDEARRVAPHNNATSLQVTAAVLAGRGLGLEHPHAGVVEPEEIDFARVLEIARPYLGELVGVSWRLDARSTAAKPCFRKTSTATIPGNSKTSASSDAPLGLHGGRGVIRAAPIPLRGAPAPSFGGLSGRTRMIDQVDEGAAYRTPLQPARCEIRSGSIRQ